MHISVPSPTSVLKCLYNEAYNSVTQVVNWKNAEGLKNFALKHPDLAVQIALPVIGVGLAVGYLAMRQLFSAEKEQPKKPLWSMHLERNRPVLVVYGKLTTDDFKEIQRLVTMWRATLPAPNYRRVRLPVFAFSRFSG